MKYLKTALAVGLMTWISYAQADPVVSDVSEDPNNTEECLACHGPLDKDHPIPVFPEFTDGSSVFKDIDLNDPDHFSESKSDPKPVTHRDE